MSIISKKTIKNHTLTSERFGQSYAAQILFGLLFFLVLCLGASDSIKGTVMVMAALALIVVAARFRILRDRICWPFIALTLVILMDGVSTFYAVSGKFALREFLKVFLAYLMAVILLAASPKEEVKGKRIATILAVCTAIGSLVGIDMVSTGWISGAVVWVLGRFSEVYAEFKGVQALERMSSIFTNANVFAGFSGIGILLGLGLADGAQSRKERCFFLVLLYLNAAAFILTVSLGAFVFELIALVAFVLLQKKERRIRTLVLMLEAAVLASVLAVIVYRMMRQTKTGIQIVPLLAAVLGAAALCGIDSVLGRIHTKKTTVQRKKAVIACAVAVLLIVVYIVAALNLTGPVTLAPNGFIERAASLKPGSYTLDLQANGDSLYLDVYSRTWIDTARGTSTTIYSGNAADAAFTVPEDSMLVYYVFTSPEGVQIDSAHFNEYKIPLNYKLLPSFLVRRLHSSYTSNSVVQRLVYFKDGLKLFRRSPVIGLGMGAFENGIKSVQSYYYETKYAHNHYFQTMLETGIVGLLLFLSLLVSSAAAIWKTRKDQPYAHMLGALWMFMAGQAIHDIVFSSYAYLPLAFGSFVLIDLCAGDALTKPKLTKTVKTVSVIVISAGTLVYCFFLAGNMMAKRNFEKSPTIQTLTRCVELDRFEWADYALPYVNNAIGDNVNKYVREQADAYAERLAKVNSNTIPIYLAEYYFNSGRMEQGFEMTEKYVDYVSSDQSAWQLAFGVLQYYDDDSDLYRNGVLRIAAKLDQWNEDNTETIRLSDETNAYIEAVRLGTSDRSGGAQ